MATANQGYINAKGARAAARKTLGKDAVETAEFEVYEIEGGRFDWKAIEIKRNKRRTGSKGNPFGSIAAKEEVGPTPEEVAAAEAALDNMANPEMEIAKLQAEADALANEAALEEPAPSKAASAFGAFATQQLSSNGDERRNENKGGERRNGDKVEKKVRVPATMQNGVRQPSIGTVCRAVWDALDKIRDSQDGVPPHSKQVKELAASLNWNPNNASIEFYQWRKFNNISGRTKVAPAPKAVKPKTE